MVQRDRIRWRKRCSTGACVEMAEVGREVHVRDSGDPDGPRLRFSPAPWRAFVAALDALRPPS